MLFESLDPLKRGQYISWLGYVGAAACGWVALETPVAIWVFAIQHGPNFAPEIGPAGSFVVFSTAYTIGYLALFILVAAPMRILVVKRESTVANRLLPLASAAVFALASGVFEWLNGSAENPGPLAALFAISGAVCMIAMQVVAK